jgi:hypothetical protein
LGLELSVELQNSEGGLTFTGFTIATRGIVPYIRMNDCGE